MDDDTGRVTFGFSFSIDSVVDDDIIKCAARADEGGSEGGGIYINPIVFEYQIPLKQTKAEPRNGGFALYFNRVGKISVDSCVFKVMLLSDTANIAKKTELHEENGFVYWSPASSLNAGTYIMQAGGFIDEYGEKSPLVNLIIVVS